MARGDHLEINLDGDDREPNARDFYSHNHGAGESETSPQAQSVPDSPMPMVVLRLPDS